MKVRYLLSAVALIGVLGAVMLAVRSRTLEHWLDQRAVERVQRTAQENRDHLGEWENQWLGLPIMQFPNDLVTYQNLIWEVKPDVVIETGTYRGGLTLFLAMILEYANPAGKVITVDITDQYWKETYLPNAPRDKLLQRITFLVGDSTSPEILRQITERIEPGASVLVLLDSNHALAHVRKELAAYSELVTKGSYLVVDDTHLDGTRWVDFQPGPRAAVREFLPKHPEYQLDTDRNRYAISGCKDGILKRIR